MTPDKSLIALVVSKSAWKRLVDSLAQSHKEFFPVIVVADNEVEVPNAVIAQLLNGPASMQLITSVQRRNVQSKKAWPLRLRRLGVRLPKRRRVADLKT